MLSKGFGQLVPQGEVDGEAGAMAAQGPGAVGPHLLHGGLGAEQDRKPNRQGKSPSHSRNKRCHADLRVRLSGHKIMKVTVELSDQEMAEILNLTGERKKGPAIRRLMEEALQQRRRAQIAQRFLSGEWGVELETYEADQESERLRAREIAP